MGFFNFIKNLFGKKKDECCAPTSVLQDPFLQTMAVETPIVSDSDPVEKAEVEKMSERLKDVTSSKPLELQSSVTSPVTEEKISVKDIKNRKKVTKEKPKNLDEKPVKKEKKAKSSKKEK